MALELPLGAGPDRYIVHRLERWWFEGVVRVWWGTAGRRGKGLGIFSSSETYYIVGKNSPTAPVTGGVRPDTLGEKRAG